MAEYQIHYSMAGCPLCGHYGPHFEAPGDQSEFACRLCRATFGVGHGEIRTMLVGDREQIATTTT